MSDTPRTDKEQGMACEWLHSTMVVPAGFARLLERELNAANAKIVELQGRLIAQAHEQPSFIFGYRE